MRTRSYSIRDGDGVWRTRHADARFEGERGTGRAERRAARRELREARGASHGYLPRACVPSLIGQLAAMRDPRGLRRTVRSQAESHGSARGDPDKSRAFGFPGEHFVGHVLHDPGGIADRPPCARESPSRPARSVSAPTMDPAPIDRVVHDDRVHADERVAADARAVDHGAVARCAPPLRARPSLRGTCGSCSSPARCTHRAISIAAPVATDARRRARLDVASDDDVARHRRLWMNERAFMDDRAKPSKA